jgi:hypothetical protein
MFVKIALTFQRTPLRVDVRDDSDDGQDKRH